MWKIAGTISIRCCLASCLHARRVFEIPIGQIAAELRQLGIRQQQMRVTRRGAALHQIVQLGNAFLDLQIALAIDPFFERFDSRKGEQQEKARKKARENHWSLVVDSGRGIESAASISGSWSIATVNEG